jgi:hypothetical protein
MEMWKKWIIGIGIFLVAVWFMGRGYQPSGITHMGRHGPYDVYCQSAGDDVDCWRQRATRADKDFRGLETR